MSYARRVDNVSAACIAEFRRCGAAWLDLSRAPGIDGVAIHHGRVYLVELKTVRGKGRVTMTARQQALVQEGWPLEIVTSPEDVRALLGRV